MGNAALALRERLRCTAVRNAFPAGALRAEFELQVAAYSAAQRASVEPPNDIPFKQTSFATEQS